MPTVQFYRDNPDDIRRKLKQIAQHLPYETMFLVNLANREDLERLIATLQNHLATLPPPVEASPGWAAYDEPFTHAMFVTRADTWPGKSKSLVQTLARRGAGDRYHRIKTGVQELDIPFRHGLYLGHVLHARVQAREDFLGYGKEQQCWQHIQQTFNLPPTPAGWMPPDMR